MHLPAQGSVHLVVKKSSLMSLFACDPGLIALKKASLDSIAQRAMTSVTYSPASLDV